MKIVVVFPTLTEAQFFSHPEVIVEFCGVGLSSAAYRTSQIIAQHRPDWLIMAGIAGVYPGSSLQIGEVVLVGREREADLGFFTPQGFTHLADLALEMDFDRQRDWHCPYIPAHPPFAVARSNSLNAAMAPFVSQQDVDIENMEGAAFFRVCLAEQQRFLQLRAISNVVRVGDDEWDFTGSIRQLTQALTQMIQHLAAQPDVR
ncbi:purine phosphorylase [Chitinibacter sp. GC72]|uniref:phosphorylase family protein n=1 Tax=Chitinibacter sp. GC72 TaxID=1526917 RepID=UPI0012FA1E21|nr:purine phosphorylase [Chitinibacter sp. GC72]